VTGPVGAIPADGPVPEAAALQRDSTRLGHRERNLLIAILMVAAAVRLGWIWYVDNGAPQSDKSGDAYWYWYYGHELAAGRGYVNPTTGTATAYYPVGFPAILAALFWLALHTPIPDNLLALTFLFQAAISVATVWLVFFVGQRLFGTMVGLVAAAVYALFPNVVYQVATIQVETTFIFLTMAALAVIVGHEWSLGSPSGPRLAAFGVVLAAAFYVRPFSIWLVVGVLLAVLSTGAGWRRALLSASIPLAIVAVVTVPWVVRNYARFDTLVVSSTNLGDTLCIDRSMDATGGFRWATHDGCVDSTLPEAERYRANTRKAISFVVHHPDRELLQIYRRGRRMFANDLDGILAVDTLSGTPFLTAGEYRAFGRLANVYFYAVVGVAVAGLLWLRQASVALRRLFLSGLVPLLVIPLLLWGNVRFHVPLLPFVSVLAAVAVCRAAQAINEWRRTPEAGGLASAVDPSGSPEAAPLADISPADARR
jgi:hypothetical protein